MTKADDLVILSDYWVRHYATDHCTLCGNSGVIDTRSSAVTATGKRVGRLNWCICPNGVGLRKGCGDLPTEIR